VRSTSPGWTMTHLRRHNLKDEATIIAMRDFAPVPPFVVKKGSRPNLQ